MSVIIPFAEFPSFTETISLDQTPYRFSFKWNYRGQFWSMGIATSEDVSIIDSIKVVMDIELIEVYALEAMPPGQMFSVSPNNTRFSIGRNDLNDGNIQIIYVPEDEVATI